MKRRLVWTVAVLTGLAMISGCSFKANPLNLFKKNSETVSEKTYRETKTENKSREEIAREINNMIDRMVEKIKAGNWNEAVTVGEAAYSITVDYFSGGPQKAAAPVKDAVYDTYGLESTKEKLYEVLTEAYDYKNHLEALNKEEKAKYVRTARLHYNINPAEPGKKLALAKVLLETGSLSEGLKLAAELYNSPARDKDITETYAWGLYLSGKKTEAYNIYKTFYPQSESLVQLYHSAVVIEEMDKLLGLILYKACELAGNNLMVLEPNVNNLSAQSYLNRIISDANKARDRLLAGGYRIDSQYNMVRVDSLVKSIVELAKS